MVRKLVNKINTESIITFFVTRNPKSRRHLVSQSTITWTKVQGKSRFWTILGYFLLIHEIEWKLSEDPKNQVLFNVISVVTMLETYLETGSKERINSLGELIGISKPWKMSCIPKLKSVNDDIKVILDWSCFRKQSVRKIN